MTTAAPHATRQQPQRPKLRKPFRLITDDRLLLPVLPLIARGLTNRTIADELGLSMDGAKSRIRSLLHRLNAVDRAHAVALAYQRGLLGPDTHHAEKVRRELADRHASTCALLRPPVCGCGADDPSDCENGEA